MTETEKTTEQKATAPAQEKKQEQTAVKKPAPAPEKTAGFCVYIGPTKLGTIQRFTVYGGSKQTVLALPELQIALRKYPAIAEMMIDGNQLAESLQKRKTKGEVLYKAYKRLAEQ